MRITYEGTVYDFDFDKIRVKQAIKVEAHVGVPLAQWGQMIERGASMLALQALGWLILADGKGAIDDVDFEVMTLGDAVTAAVAAEAAQEAPVAGPTAPNGEAAPQAWESRSSSPTG